MSNNRSTSAATEGFTQWLSSHLYYHQDLDRAIRGFVRPLVVSLIRDQTIDGFFFLRYALGGPHLRLRLRVTPGSREAAQQALEESARAFLDLEPSTRSVDPETIRQWNQEIVARDRQEHELTVYPDNSLEILPFRPEVERYGGREMLDASLDFFAVSSVAALHLLSTWTETSRSAILTQGFGLLLQQALGFAVTRQELGDLLRYGVDSWGEPMPTIVEKADRQARSRGDFFRELFRKGCAAVRSRTPETEPTIQPFDLLDISSRHLSSYLGSADPEARARVGGSHLHMTASRLGLTNAEEVYLSRLLSVTFEGTSRNSDELRWLADREQPLSGDPSSLRRLLASALAALGEPSAR